MNKPFVIDIKGNSLDDGPGIRSTVFFKGCPLSCIWCHNPESKRVQAELSYERKDCIGDGGCIKVCKNGALGIVPEFLDRTKCKLCFACTNACPAKALSRVGNDMEHDEILKKLLRDKPFYDVSGGGVTLSGGEATMFPEWVGALAKSLKENGVNILLETCGYFNYDKVREFILPYLHDIYCDIKIFDRDKHLKYCGVKNDLILDNFRKMFLDKDVFGYTLLPRVPLVPDITDTKENLLGIATYLKDLGVKKASLLPYNPTWYNKATKLGVEVADELKSLTKFQEKDKVEGCRDIFRNLGIEC